MITHDEYIKRREDLLDKCVDNTIEARLGWKQHKNLTRYQKELRVVYTEAQQDIDELVLAVIGGSYPKTENETNDDVVWRTAFNNLVTGQRSIVKGEL